MADQEIQIQISELNRKLDLLLESAEQQKRNREEINDLVADLNIVAKDAFQQTVIMLDKSQVELNNDQLSGLLIKLLHNLGTFSEMLDLMESARDLVKDLSPVLHQMGLDAVNKMNELDQKGYFEFATALMQFADKFIRTFNAEDLRRMEGSIGDMAGIIRNITDPGLLATLNRTLRSVNEIKMNDQDDNVPLWKIMMQLRSREVRKTLSYSIRLLKAINKS